MNKKNKFIYNMYISPDSSPENNNPVSNPFTNLVSNPFTNPVSNQFTNPVSNQFTNPVSNPFTNPVSNPFTNPVSNPTTNIKYNPFTKKTKKMNNRVNTKNINDMEISPNSDMEISPNSDMEISPNSDTVKRHIPKHIMNAVLKRQDNKCANSIKDYQCLLWKINNGNFDEAGYQFDHINEYCLTKDNSLDNIQALCPNCHSVKTKKFRKNKNLFTTQELDNGSGLMEIC